mmetsp:Transcript_9797/g.21194  ORF Transcript_9797/g.21194 Transcript_9797/m.21194 type:complete len:293 (-) Transcript_9797:6900-7778(-)
MFPSSSMAVRRILSGRGGAASFAQRQQATTTMTPSIRTLTTTTGRPPAPRVPPTTAIHPLASQVSTAGTGRQAAGIFALNRKTPVTWTSLFFVAVVAGSAVTYYQLERERRLEAALGQVVSTGKPAIGGPWSLVDMDGNLVTEQSFVGKWTLLYFGFARCPDICPSEMNKVARVLDTLKQQYPELYQKIVPVFVSVDPARDSIQVLKDYGADFHPDYIFLTGSPSQVQQMAKRYRVYVSKADEVGDDYLVDHSIVIYFHDDTGDLADCFTQSMRSTDVVEKLVDKMLNKPKN